MLRSMANIEVKKFANMVSAIGADTLAAISRAGPETQVSFYRISSIIREFFSFQNNPKDLDLSCKMDLDLWDCLGRVKICINTKFHRTDLVI